MNIVNRQIVGVQQANLYRDSLNPLRMLTMPRAVSMMEQAQRGIFPDLMWTYGADTGIEGTDADLMVILERSLAAVCDSEWQVEQIDSDTQGFDQVLADDQEAFLREHYEGCENLREAWEHLALARFRGFAHVNPQFGPSGTLCRLEPLDQWNFCRAGSRGAWYWNPKATQVEATSLGADNLLTARDYVMMEWKRPVNRIGIIKYVRQSVSEKDWDYYIECYGIPGTFVIMPQQIPAGQEEKYLQAAEDASKAGSGALPAGSSVTVPGEGTRATQPFQPRLEWLQKQLVLAGTGGLLTVLTESGSGTLAGSVHEQAFRQIGRALANRISEAFQQQFDKPKLQEQFPGRPVQAYFEIKARQQKITAEIVKDFVALAGAFELDPEEVTRETGYTVLSQRAAPAASGGGYGNLLARASCRQSGSQSSQDPMLALQDAAVGLYVQAVEADCKPLADGLRAALAAPDFATLQARLSDLRQQLPTLAKEMLAKPASAAVLSQAMSAALFNGMAEQAARFKAKVAARGANRRRSSK